MLPFFITLPTNSLYMENAFALGIMVVVCVLLIIVIVIMAAYMAADYIDRACIYLFNKPAFVHFYPFKKSLPADTEEMLYEEFAFYRHLSRRHRRYFNHRVSKFLSKYEFVGREGIHVTEIMKAKIAATWVMLTFGMRYYLPGIFKHILVFPDIYQSAVTGLWHKGEFNHPAAAVVFSWKHFTEGMKYGTDNINLGLHEFAHALHVCATTTDDGGASGDLYAIMFDKVLEYLGNADNLKHLAAMGYLRDYAFTNQFEFMAVTLETFFETPAEFKQKLPELYGIISKMINYDPADTKHFNSDGAQLRSLKG